MQQVALSIITYQHYDCSVKYGLMVTSKHCKKLHKTIYNTHSIRFSCYLRNCSSVCLARCPSGKFLPSFSLILSFCSSSHIQSNSQSVTLASIRPPTIFHSSSCLPARPLCPPPPSLSSQSCLITRLRHPPPPLRSFILIYNPFTHAKCRRCLHTHMTGRNQVRVILSDNDN